MDCTISFWLFPCIVYRNTACFTNDTGYLFKILSVLCQLCHSLSLKRSQAKKMFCMMAKQNLVLNQKHSFFQMESSKLILTEIKN